MPVPKGGKVLIIDDEKSNRRILEGYLLSEGYSIYQAANGREALDIIPIISPDIILLDLMMPELDGFDVCRLLKNNNSFKIIPVIIITALEDRDSKLKALEAGADDFLSKPVDPLELQIRVKSLIKVKKYYEKIEEINQKLTANLVKAQKLQQALIPKEFPNSPNVKFEAFYQSADFVGGDFFNICQMDENRTCIYITDVTGHGIDAAMLTVFIKETLNSYIRKLVDNHNIFSPKACLEYLDDKFKGEGFPGDIFITIFLGVFNQSNLEFKYSAAGFFEFPYIFGPRGIWQLSCPGSLIIAHGSPGEYEEKSIMLHQGESILFYTDGLIEQQSDSGEVFGAERLNMLLEGAKVTDSPVIGAIISSLKVFCHRETFDDDIVLVHLKTVF